MVVWNSSFWQRAHMYGGRRSTQPFADKLWNRMSQPRLSGVARVTTICQFSFHMYCEVESSVVMVLHSGVAGMGRRDVDCNVWMGGAFDHVCHSGVRTSDEKDCILLMTFVADHM